MQPQSSLLISPPAFLGRARARRAFSLVEVVLALGVFSFSMISIVGLIPGALLAYQKASGTTIDAQIVQNVTAQVELTGIANIPTPPSTTNYYFDAQGLPVAATAGTKLYTAAVNFSYVGSGGAAKTAPLLDSLQTNSAFNVNIAITCQSKPSQTNYFSTILAY